MADVHQRVGGPWWRSATLQYQGHHQGRRQRTAGRHSNSRQLRVSSDGKPRGQGGKSRGVYPPIYRSELFFNKFPFDIFTSKYEEAFCEANICLNKPPVINSTSSFITVRFITSNSSFQVFDDVCSELAMAILQFFQVEIHYKSSFPTILLASWRKRLPGLTLEYESK